mgnify:CR=1 FL=1
MAGVLTISLTKKQSIALNLIRLFITPRLPIFISVNIMKFISLFSLVLLLSGCSAFQTENKSTDLYVTWTEPQKMYFQGKGAGAGMALMSTMGAMGMAIGVAIDEGISKDISKMQQQSGETIQSLFEQVSEGTQYKINWVDNKSLKAQKNSLILERIEFNLVRGGKNDATEVKIKALYIDDSGQSRHINYPKDVPDLEQISFPLEQLKKDNTLANKLLLNGFQTILASMQ